MDKIFEIDGNGNPAIIKKDCIMAVFVKKTLNFDHTFIGHSTIIKLKDGTEFTDMFFDSCECDSEYHARERLYELKNLIW